MPLKLIEVGVVGLLLLGIALFRAPRPARLGNLLAGLALLCGAGVVLSRHGLSPAGLILACVGLGAAAGWILSMRVTMIRIPAMVALQNGMGGMASFLVAFVELTRCTDGAGGPGVRGAALLGMVTGAVTLTGSLVAGGRLGNLLDQRPVHMPGHSLILAGLAAAAVLLAGGALAAGDSTVLRGLAIGVVLTAGGLGVALAVRVGGADMPVLISFLNAASGLAAAFCGLAIGSWLLVACGAMVGVSGTILTQIMCRAMNRRLAGVLAGSGLAFGGPREPGANVLTPHAPERGPAEAESAVSQAASPAAAPSGRTASAATSSAAAPSATATSAASPSAATPSGGAASSAAIDPFARAVEILRAARSVIIVPGYGMALAGAQEETVQLAEQLAGAGRSVIFAIHPVAGRMPGHMHVLLAEAEVDYGMIREMDQVNPIFAETDVVVVVGACDVVNPAAIRQEGTPISGMPVLRAHEARAVVVCNLDARPGYSGVENPLYREPHTVMLTGDAGDTLRRLREALA